MRDKRLILVGLAFLLLAFALYLPSLMQKRPEQAPVVGDVPVSKAEEYTFDVEAGARLEFVERSPGHLLGTINQGTTLLMLSSTSGDIIISPD